MIASRLASKQPARSVLRGLAYVGEGVATFGSMLDFGRRAIFHSVVSIGIRQKYRSVVFQQISDVVTGAGAVLAGGGMIFVIAAMSLATGATVGLQGFTALQQIGAQSFSGLIASFGNVREVTPIIAGVALAAQVGAGFTAEIGAMRISDEIDALEVMSIHSLEYVVCTRLVATLVALIPLYFVSLFASFFASRVITTQYLGLSPGIYDHYFHFYLPPLDIAYSIVKVIIFAVAVVLIHCYYGYYATGGPAGVGVAVGRAIRLSIITIVLINLFLSFVFWGTTNTVSITG
jgi:phospholipid/cholesterol/gamma-HCH transport system permease protein